MKPSIRFLLVVASLATFASFPAHGQNALLDLYSPAFLAGGANVAGTASPQADVVNPAASGGTQRLTVDLSYLGLAGLGGAPGWGNTVNAGITIPTPVGVFTGSARFLYAEFPSLDIGSLGAFNLSFAKDLFPDLYVGAGLGFQIGLDWGLGLDIGFLHLPGDVAFLRDFRWGASLRGMGKPYAPSFLAAGVGSAPPIFTPDLGVSFSVLKTRPVTISLSSDLSFPSFQDVRFGLGSRITVLDLVSLDVSYEFDLRDVLAGRAKAFPFSFGVSGAIPLAPGDLSIAAAGAPLYDGVWGFGLGGTFSFGQIDRIAPVITLASAETAYISPNTASTQGSLGVALTIAENRYLKGYRLIVKEEGGGAARTIEVSDKGPPSTGFQNIVDRLLSVKKSIEVPPSISWDGKNDAGTQVGDGAYAYTVEAWDENGNIARTDPLAVVVDTAPPSATVRAQYLEFSPTGEGTKGNLAIEQSGSTEDLWVGTITDAAGNEVRQFRWTGDQPKNFTWTGKDTSGKIAADGTYVYRLSSTDRAGNTGTVSLEGIIINTEATPIGLSIDLPAFSPNGDGIKDVIRILASVKVTAGIDAWKLSVKDLAGSVRRVFSGTTSVPGALSFDGNDDAGVRLPEGPYQASLNVVYHNGHTPTADSPVFTLRVTPPSATVSAARLEFSPDGVGTRTTLPIAQSGSVEILWEGSIQSAAGALVKSFRWDESAPKDFSWDGREESGALAPDGSYRYALSSTDPAGTTGSAALDGIVVNTAATPVSLSVDLSAFSPNGDGAKDALRFSLAVPVAKGIETWSLAVRDASRNPRRAFSGQGRPPATLEFDGKGDDGATLPEGLYAATLSLVYANGHVPANDSPPFVIDLTLPTATASSDFAAFSPVGEGARNLLTFTQAGSKDAAWTGTVADAAGKPVRAASWKGRPDGKFVFDGHGDDGALLPDGKYTYALTAIDNAGNAGSAAPVAFEIDTTDTPVIVSTDLAQFSPNGDGSKDALRIVPSLKVATGIDSFELRIRNDKGALVRAVKGTAVAPVDFTWDGLSDAKQKVPDGPYVAELDLLYRNGNHPVVKTNPFVIDTVFPTIAVAADVLLFSPTEGSSVASMAVRQSSSDEDQWTGQVQDSSGAAARSFSWKGKAANFPWDGKDDTGNTVPDGTYRYVVSAVDKAGNKTVKSLEGIRVDTRPTPTSVKALADGLSPNLDGFRDTIGFSLSVGLSEGITSWKLTMGEAAKGAQKIFSGQAPVPPSIVWDGRNDKGGVTEGTFTAQLEVQYAKGNRPSTASAPFVLSTTPAKLALTAGPIPFSPDGDGSNDLLTIALQASGASPIESWEIAVSDPAGHPFIGFSGKDAPPGPITWDGLSANGELVQSAEDYAMAVTVRDSLGNVARAAQKIPIDVLVIRDGNRLKVRVTSIVFAANTADYQNVEKESVDKNLQTLGRLAQVFKKYSQYKIRIEGHAVMINWNNPEEGKKEQQSVLIPLSKARADAVRIALVKLGIEASRITTEGIGGAVPIVPFSDLENRWKNRRVEFILVRE